jgi:hypothetical protein
MKNIAENNLIRFKNVTKKKNGVFANFLCTGVRGGTTIRASIAIDIAAAEVDLADPMEKIIEECARIAAKDIKASQYEFEGLQNV